MLRMFRELKGSYRYIVLIFALLFGQAFCDLALPSYTSDIINVGVQQGGIPDSVPDQIRESSMNQLFLFMDGDQQQEVKEYYTLKDGVYTHKKLKEEERDSLNTIFRKVDAGSKQSAAARYTECSGREDAASRTDAVCRRHQHSFRKRREDR